MSGHAASAVPASPARDWDDGFAIAPSRRWAAAAVLFAANAMVALDMTVANVAVPHIAGSVGASLEQGTWVITSYAVAEAIAVPLTGWLVARFGAVRLVLVAMAGFSLFSLLCGMSLTLPMLVVCRIGQGLTGGLIMPMAQTLIYRIFPSHQLPKAFTYWMLTLTVAPAAGPIVGGFIADHASWHWIFLINVPIGVAAVILGYSLLRPIETERVRRPVDRVGLALLVIWIGALQLMLDTGREKDWFADWSIVALALTSLVGLCAFIVWELTEEHPIVDIRLLRHRPFTMCLIGSALAYGAYFSGIVVVPQWLQSVMGYTATQAGIVTATSAAAALLSGQLTLRLMYRVDGRMLVTMGAIWVGLCFALRSTWSTDFDMFHLALIFALQGLGITLLQMPLNTMALSSLTLEETAGGAGLSNFVRTMSAAISAAVALTFWTNQQAVSRDAIVQSLHPEQATAVMTSAGLPALGQAAYLSALVDRQAVTEGMVHTFAASAVALFSVAVLVWAVPRVEMTRLKGEQGGMADH